MTGQTTDNNELLEGAHQKAAALIARDPQMREARTASETLAELNTCRTALETFLLATEKFADRPALGARTATSPFTTLTYRELRTRVEHLASALYEQGVTRPGDFVGILGFASPDFVVAELACLYLSAVSVPLQSNMPPADLKHIIDEADISTLFCSRDQRAQLADVLPDLPKIKKVILIDGESGDPTLPTIRQIEATAQSTVAPQIPAPGTDPLITLMYTSGSTGLPKGAMFPESIWVQVWKQGMTNFTFDLPHVAVNFMPLNHVMGRAMVMQGILRGGTTYFTLKSDMSTLLEDFRTVQPTVLGLVPRVSEMIYQQYQIERIRHPSEGEEETLARQRYSLGDRLLIATTGSAPTSPEVMDFLKRCFQIPVYVGYGSTEANMISFEDKIDRRIVREYRLVDVPELGYRTSDTPFPRGELRIKTPRMIPGYLKNEAATRDLYDPEGFLRTGDIVEERGENHVVWIDRVKNILKLSQGEFVSLWRLESLFSGESPLIHQIYLFGNSLRSYLLAVIVPDPAAVRSADPTRVKQLLREELSRVARAKGLHAWETPRDFIVENEPFTKENGLLTESNKPARAKLNARYGTELNARYDAIEKGQFKELTELHAGRDTLSIGARVQKAIGATLGVAAVGLEQTFADLGGDSLAAVRVSTLVEEVTGVALPVSVILGKASTVRDIVAYVEKKPDGPSVTFETIHGVGARTARAQDLTLDKFLSADEIAAAQNLPVSIESTQTALLTGANGFLGRYLTLELLRQLPPRGTVYALVRAQNDAAALERLREGFAQGEPTLLETFEELSADRLVVLAGDLIKPRFGLAEGDYLRLAREVDTVVHNGALVNHAFTYPQLFEPNVLGTVEVMRFALAERRKRLNFISTVAVPGGAGDGRPVPESATGRTLWRERAVDSGYASGYATSKWADEVLLQDYAERFQLPVNIFRCGMILADSQTLGQINVPDFFTRLLLGIVYTGVAPKSFYAGEKSAHFDGLPVDFLARNITHIATTTHQGYQTFHSMNAHYDDGISLDRIVDWIGTAGYPIDRVGDYQQWYRMFGDRLNALPETEKRHSPLPILYQWEHPIDPGNETHLDQSRFIAEGAPVPHLDEGFIHQCLKDLTALKLIKGANA